MNNPTALRVMLVDPSLFTGPYDAALTRGLIAAGVQPTWAVRPTRPGDRADLEPEHTDAFFYRHVDGLAGLPGGLRAVAKGASHIVGLAQLMFRVRRRRPDVVHFQWTVVPALDALAMLFIRRHSTVVLTVHDTTPFNGDRLAWLQRAGYRWPMRVAQRVIVHTKEARRSLVAQGLSSVAIEVISHGPLRLRAHSPASARAERDPRYTLVVFGELKAYKGIDVLIDALALLPDALRSRTKVLVTGRPRMDIAPLLERIRLHGLQGVIELQPRRISEEEMADLFARTDCFVFPYRNVDASGVYFLVRSMGRWIIASRVGVFAEAIEDGVEGDLVPPADAPALSAALARAIVGRTKPASLPTPAGAEWDAIGSATLAVYRAARQPRGRS
ncbi:MAG TPA: glycosyltransferase [Polyangiaceae bacterium]|nr:glycosyltransferase [Polyangiaceae bacterium]